MVAPDERGAIPGRVLTGLREHDVSGLSAEMAYRFLFAALPFSLCVAAMGSLVGRWLHVKDPAAQIVASLGDNLPAELAAAIRPEFERLLTTARTDLVLVGAIAALLAATGGTNALTKGVHRAYGVEEQRPFVLRYAIALVLTVVGAAGLIAGFVTIVGGALLTQQIAATIGLEAQAYAVVRLLRWPSAFTFVVVAVVTVYRYGSSVVAPWRWIVAGAIVFAGGWVVATAALAFYAVNVADYGATYGSLGGLIVLMLWFYATAAMLLVGAEVTAALARDRSPAEITRRSEEAAAAHVVDDATGGVAGPPRVPAPSVTDGGRR